MKDLPLDVLTCIFTCTKRSRKALAIYSIVCRSWCTAAQHQLFLHVHVKTQTDAETIIAAVTTNPRLQGVSKRLSFKLKKFAYVPSKILRSLFMALPNLTSFTLINSFLDACLELSFEEIGQLVPNVTNLKVVEFNSWIAVLHLVGSMPSLTGLDVRLCAGEESRDETSARVPEPRATGLRRLGLSMTSILAKHGRFFSQLILFPGTENINITGWLYTCNYDDKIPTFKFNNRMLPFVTSLYIRICGPGSFGNLDITVFPTLNSVSIESGPCVTPGQIFVLFPLLPSETRQLFMFAEGFHEDIHFASGVRLKTDVFLSRLSRFKDLEYFSVTENMVGPFTQEKITKAFEGIETTLEILPPATDTNEFIDF